MQRKGGVKFSTPQAADGLMTRNHRDNLNVYHRAANSRKGFISLTMILKVVLLIGMVGIWGTLYSTISASNATGLVDNNEPPTVSYHVKIRDVLPNDYTSSKKENKYEDQLNKNVDVAHTVSSELNAHNKATRRMLAMPSSFVDGEKKLKEELRKLMNRQENGMDLGVKVSSMWLDGEPVVFPGEKHKN